jgi:type IV pilus assembly protein PilA
MKKNMQGFTLIELMIVVAIIAILAAIAISQYQDYVIRSQVSEGSALADGTKTAMAEYQNNKGFFPASNSAAGLASAGSIQGSYVTQVDVGATTGKVTVTYGKQAHANITGDVLVFSAIRHAGSIEWSCTPAAGTNVEEKYLPTKCRTN